MDLIQYRTLFRRRDWHRPITTTFCPRSLDGDMVATVGIAELELDGLFPPQTESPRD